MSEAQGCLTLLITAICSRSREKGLARSPSCENRGEKNRVSYFALRRLDLQSVSKMRFQEMAFWSVALIKGYADLLFFANVREKPDIEN